MDLGLTGKIAFVTGGSRGIGKAIALELAREGVVVAICGRNLEPLEETARQLQDMTGRRILPVTGDVSRTDEVNAMVARVVQEFGALHILVNNAAAVGGLAAGPLANIDDAAVLEDFNTKYLGYLRCARAVAPHLQRQGWGRIVNIGGLAARNSGAISGGARNVAVVHLTKTLADELGPSGVTVNAIHPGTTRTERRREERTEQAERQGVSLEEVEVRMATGNAIRRMVDASEIAYVAVFLASEKAAAITGDVIVASGGAGRSVYY
jgi:NAD(P)-dependent dehydrogenase (short-subunit alcohol dehydrogenase family)